MADKANWILKNLHLLISVIIVVPTGIIYGSPSILPKYFDIQVGTTDLSNMLKAIMLLYLGAAAVWILGILRTEYWKRATELNILFMLTLAIGRLLSIIIDGLPTEGFILGLIVELIIGLFSIYQLKNINRIKNK